MVRHGGARFFTRLTVAAATAGSFTHVACSSDPQTLREDPTELGVDAGVRRDAGGASDSAPASPEDARAPLDAADGDAADGAAADPYRDAVMLDAPRGYWRLDEKSGAVAKDEIGQHDGQYTGTLTRGMPGALASAAHTAVYFGGTTGQVVIGDVFDFAGAVPFTVEAWVLKDGPGPATNLCIVCKFDGAGHGLFRLQGSTDNLLFYRLNAGGTAISRPMPASFVHAVGTWDGTKGTLYLDGVASPSTASTTQLPDRPQPLAIGGNGTSDLAFKGTVDEVAVYDKALSAARVQAHFAAAKQ